MKFLSLLFISIIFIQCDFEEDKQRAQDRRDKFSIVSNAIKEHIKENKDTNEMFIEGSIG
jgi:hypothetical protein